MSRHKQPESLSGFRIDALPWLLEESNPCVRYRALTELLDRPPDCREVRAARDAAWAWPPAARVLQMAGDPEHFAWPAGTKLTAAQPGRDIGMAPRLGIPAGHPALRKAAEFLKGRLPEVRGSDCYLPELVMASVRFGDPADPQTVRIVETVALNEALADGNRPPTVVQGRARTCCGSHSCHSAVVRALDCVASFPEASRTDTMRQFLARGADFLAAHRLYQKNHHRFRPIQGYYTELHQPWGLDWKTDILDLLDVATRMGMSDSPALLDALRLLIQKQRPDGRWLLEAGCRTDRPLVANLLSDVENPGQPGKWVTLEALLMLKRCAGLVARIEAGDEVPFEPPRPPAGFVPYPAYAKADEARLRAAWGELPGMGAVLDGLVAFAHKHRIKTGWRRDFVMGPDDCREWCCSMTKLVPAKSMRAAFPVARTAFLAPRGQFAIADLTARMGGGVTHGYPTPVKPGTWVEQALWRLRVDRWNDVWDMVGIAIRDKSEMTAAARVMAEALKGAKAAMPGRTCA
jgi:hypothetical protein